MAKKRTFTWGKNMVNPKQARLAHLACLGCQSECKIHFTLPAHGFRDRYDVITFAHLQANKISLSYLEKKNSAFLEPMTFLKA